MKELYAEGVANRSGPESWGGLREEVAQALTGASAGAVIEPRKKLPDADPVCVAGRPRGTHRYREMRSGPAGSETRRTSRTFEHENREIPEAPGGAVRPGRTVQGHPERPS